MKKIVIAAASACVAALSLSSPASAAKPQIFVVKADKIIKGTRHITAVQESSRKVAMIEVSRKGDISATVEGKPVRARLDL